MSRARLLRDSVVAGGEAALDELIRSRTTEAHHLDFKLWSMNPADNTRNLSKAVSGFANTDGGIIVWGIDARATRGDPVDVARGKRPIADVADALAVLTGQTSDAVTPPPSGVEHDVVAVSGDRGFMVTLVPMSASAPHHARDGHYYLRAGSSFIRMPHPVLSAMFGRRPSPRLQLGVDVLKIESPSPNVLVALSLGVVNNGLVPARSPYLVVASWSAPSAKSGLSFRAHHQRYGAFHLNDYSTHGADAVGASTIATNSLLPPHGVQPAVRADMQLARPIDTDLVLGGVVGAEGVAPAKFQMVLARDALVTAMDRTFGRARLDGDEAARRFLRAFGAESLSGGKYRGM